MASDAAGTAESSIMLSAGSSSATGTRSAMVSHSKISALLAAAKRCSGLFISCRTTGVVAWVGSPRGSCCCLVLMRGAAAVAATEIAFSRPAGTRACIVSVGVMMRYREGMGTHVRHLSADGLVHNNQAPQVPLQRLRHVETKTALHLQRFWTCWTNM